MKAYAVIFQGGMGLSGSLSRRKEVSEWSYRASCMEPSSRTRYRPLHRSVKQSMGTSVCHRYILGYELAFGRVGFPILLLEGFGEKPRSVRNQRGLFRYKVHKAQFAVVREQAGCSDLTDWPEQSKEAFAPIHKGAVVPEHCQVQRATEFVIVTLGLL